MPLDFPTSPALNQVYSLGGKSWKWNGDAWETYNDNLGVDFVETVNGATGDIGVVGGTDISVSTAGKTLTINYTGSGGGGGGGTNVVTSFNGRTGAVQGVSAAVAGTGISVSGSTGSVTITNTGVLSFNGITGSIQGVSSVNGKTGAVKISTQIYRVLDPAQEVAEYGTNKPLFASAVAGQEGVTMVNVSVVFNSILDPRTLSSTPKKLYDGDRWLNNGNGVMYTWYSQPDNLSPTGLTGQWVEF
jgi:hypothetical protein